MRCAGCQPRRGCSCPERARGRSRRAAGGDHRAAHARRHRPAGRRARGRGRRRARGGGGCMSPIDEGHLHSDPGIEARHPQAHPACAGATPLQRDAALTIFQKGAPGRRAFVCPDLDVPAVDVSELLPERFRRAEPPRLPEVSEPEIVRHYVSISKRNFDLDSGFYPLGSCTMKHNPRLHERVAALPGHARLHPLQDPERAQGALELMWNLQGALSELSGLGNVSLQPSAGSHGELAGVLLTRAYHEDRGESRHKVLTPDTAHGTNPATVTMAGYEVVKLATNADGGIDIEDLRSKADTDVACLMLTNPNTLGLFDPNISQIAEIVHGVGATLYYDGANLNAIMGLSRPGDMGFDIVHFNLHKSFTQPHGGGGPGSGPIAVSEAIEPYLPRPVLVRHGGAEGNGSSLEFDLDYDRPKSIGRLRGFVLRGAPRKQELGIRTLDLAKRLLDHGYHPPTVYFPLLVEEALLIEPTETETKETLDEFAAVIAEILLEAREDPEIARSAPHSTPIRRLDEAGAAKRPVLRQAL